MAELHEETIAVLSDPEDLGRYPRGRRAYARGDVVRGIDAVRFAR